MNALKEFFKKKKAAAKFKLAGPGHKLAPASGGSGGQTAWQPASALASPRVASAAEPPSRAACACLTAEQRKAADAALLRAAVAPRGVPAKAHARTAVVQPLNSSEPPKVALLELPAPPHLSEGESSLPLRERCQVSIRYKCELIPGEILSKHDMEARIEEYLLTQLAGDAPEMAAALMIHTLNTNSGQASACIEMIVKYLDNIICNPGDEKYRKIRAANKIFQERVASHKGAMEFLLAVGFELKQIRTPDSEREVLEDYYVLSGEGGVAHPDRLAELKDVLNSAEAIRPELDNDIRVYRATLPASASRFGELPGEFYRITPDELKREQQARTEALEKAGMLRTRAMRERDERRELQRYRYTVVRVRLPAGDLVLQATMHASDRLQTLIDVLHRCLCFDWLPFHLTEGASGGTLTEFDKTLAELQLTPAVVVNLTLDPSVIADAAAQLGSFDISQLLRPDLHAIVRTLT